MSDFYNDPHKPGRKIGVPAKGKGGRPPGAPNKITTNLILELERLGYQPAAKLVEMIETSYADYLETGEPALIQNATRAAVDLMRFVYPMRKAIDVTSNGENVGRGLAELVANVLIAAQDAPKQIE